MNVPCEALISILCQYLYSAILDVMKIADFDILNMHTSLQNDSQMFAFRLCCQSYGSTKQEIDALAINIEVKELRQTLLYYYVIRR